MSSIPISGPAGGGSSTSAAKPADATRQPSGEESDRFQRMVEEREGKGRGRDQEHSGDEDRSGRDGEALPSPGELMLRRLQGVPDPGKLEATAARGTIDSLAGQIADRVLVAKDGLAGGSEVRIQLKDSVLPDTEIRIAQVDGRLEIQLVAGSATALDALRGQDTLLQGRLQDKLGQEVVVVLSSGGAEAGHGDGRSRQQRNIAEEQADRE
ncbi:MAG: type III secretion HpaP family protein [Dongiaceae bacterium]